MKSVPNQRVSRSKVRPASRSKIGTLRDGDESVSGVAAGCVVAYLSRWLRSYVV